MALATRMHRLCNVGRDQDLPEVHRLVAKSPKHQAYSLIASAVADNLVQSALPLTQWQMPVVSSAMVEEVFRSFLPANTGQTFAKGLSPFAVICENHTQAATVQALAKKAEMAESAATGVTLADSSLLTSTDVRLPTNPFQAAEQLYAFSVVIDAFHGRAHPISDAVRNFVKAIGPCLNSIVTHAGAEASGMDRVLAVMYETQQEYFEWALSTANHPAGAGAPIPTFSDIKKKVLSQRTDGLASIPASWYALISGGTSKPAAKNTARSPRDAAGMQVKRNHQADSSLLARFKASGHSKIGAMIGDHKVSIPKVGGKEVCLVWALKGACSSGCDRKANHVTYDKDTNQKLHKLLDVCGVEGSQE